MVKRFKELSKGKKTLVIFISVLFLPITLTFGGVGLIFNGFKSKNFKSLIGGLALMVLSLVMFNPLGSHDREVSTKEKEIVSTSSEVNTTEVKEEDTSIPSIAAKTLKDGQVLDIQYSDIEEQNPLIIKVKLSDNLTNKFMIRGAFMDAQKVIKALEPEHSNNISKYGFWFVTDLTDKYGNVEEGKVLSFEYNRETLDKINWDNMYTDMFMDLAENAWVHPALTK